MKRKKVQNKIEKKREDNTKCLKNKRKEGSKNDKRKKNDKIRHKNRESDIKTEKNWIENRNEKVEYEKCRECEEKFANLIQKKERKKD